MEQQIPAKLKSPAPPNPFPGALLRALALLIDVYAIYAALTLLAPVLRPVYYASGFAGYHLGLLVFVLYFVLCEGPLGKGVTLGKAILQLQVVRRDFTPLSFPAALARNVRFILFAFYLKPNLALTAMIVPVPSAEFHANSYPGIDEALLLLLDQQSPYMLPLLFQLVIAGFAFSIANVVMVALHPQKRGLHDLLAGSLVIRQTARNQAREQIGATGAKSEKPFYAIFVVVSLLIPLALGETFIWKNLDTARMRRERDMQREIQERFALPDAYPVAGYFDLLALPDNRMASSLHADAVLQQLAEGRVYPLQQSAADATSGADQPTTAVAFSAADLTRLRIFRMIYYHRDAAQPEEAAALHAALREAEGKIREHCLELMRRKEYPFVDEDARVADFPTSAILLLQSVEAYNFCITAHWRSDWISTSALNLNSGNN